ncbi:CD99 antigen, partial [Carlito syrichta]|uniref:CD99 antigen n=1 Tax=Carlito syrichta TaxID=1868482 RepID=A0A1U7T1D4_CARSF
FDLEHALDSAEEPKPTVPAPRKPGAGDDFNLEDAVAGGFSDADLLDGTSGGEGGGGGGGGGGSPRKDGKEGEQEDAPGVIPGIVGAIVVAVAGAVSSFIAYQKKKLCFKENAEQGEVSMEDHRTVQAEPAVQRTLLQK